jgi:hypothetical protein
MQLYETLARLGERIPLESKNVAGKIHQSYLNRDKKILNTSNGLVEITNKSYCTTFSFAALLSQLVQGFIFYFNQP